VLGFELELYEIVPPAGLSPTQGLILRHNTDIRRLDAAVVDYNFIFCSPLRIEARKLDTLQYTLVTEGDEGESRA
jgi:hypothetical protein